MDDQQRNGSNMLTTPMTRRAIIKAGGIAALGIAFTKPAIDTIYPKPSFAQMSPLVTPPRPCIEPPAGMIAWWPGDGNTNELVGGNNGTLESGAGFAPGKVSQAFSFSGGSHVSVPDNPLWTLGNNPFTIDFWVNFNQVFFRSPFIAHDDGGGMLNKWIFWYDETGHRNHGIPALRFHVNSPAGPSLDTVIAPWNPNTGRWYHLAVRRTGNDYSIFIDGANVATESDANPIPDPSLPLTIGKAEALYLDGLMDEVEMFNRALGDAEIQAIYNAGSDGKCKDF